MGRSKIQKQPPWPATLSDADRVERARILVSRQIDDLLELIAISEANRFIIYSPTLAEQIPPSFAANAFNIFQWSSLNYEIIRVCAFWDSPRDDRTSIPTVLKLLDGSACRAIVEGALGKDQRYTERQMRRLDRAVRVAQKVMRSRFITALQGFRNERVAHNLDFSARAAPSSVLKYGYERRLLRASIAVVSNLNNAIRDSHFMFDDAIAQSRRNAAAFWKGCKIEVLE